VLRRALASETATDAQRAEALEVLGATYVILDRDREARETFEELFAIACDTAEGGTGPLA